MFFGYSNWTFLKIEQVWDETIYSIDLTKILPKHKTNTIYTFIHPFRKHLLIMCISGLLQHVSSFVYRDIYFYLECILLCFIFCFCFLWPFELIVMEPGSRFIFCSEISVWSLTRYLIHFIFMEKGGKCSYYVLFLEMRLEPEQVSQSLGSISLYSDGWGWGATIIMRINISF